MKFCLAPNYESISRPCGVPLPSRRVVTPPQRPSRRCSPPPSTLGTTSRWPAPVRILHHPPPSALPVSSIPRGTALVRLAFSTPYHTGILWIQVWLGSISLIVEWVGMLSLPSHPQRESVSEMGTQLLSPPPSHPLV